MSKKIMLGLIACSMAFAMACKSEIDNKPEAQVNEPAEVAQQEDAEKVEKVEQTLVEVPVKKEGSKIEWVGAKVTGDHTGGFNEWTGTATLNTDGELQKLQFEVDTTSIYSDNERLTGHLKSDDFFDVENHPKASFVATKVAEGSDVEGATHTITGNMTLLGVTKELVIPATLKVEGNQWTGTSEFRFKRFDFGITYAGKADDLIKDEVAMKLQFVADLAPEATAEADPEVD